MSKLRIGDIFRYNKSYDPATAEIDGYPNFLNTTHYPGQNKALLESGINPIGSVKAIDGPRYPAILIRSSPHKIGSRETPWQDTFDTDNGHIRYYGDNKEPGKDPHVASGNQDLLEAFSSHSAIDKELRKNAIPLVFYRSERVGKKTKGYVKFHGFGIIETYEPVTQYDRAEKRAFPNLVFNFVIFNMFKEYEEFDWDWINDRRNPNLTLKETLKRAPNSWKDWIEKGPKSIERNRHRVSRILIASVAEQKPIPLSEEAKELKKIYDYYAKKKNRFEGLASVIVARYIKQNGGIYREGWITPPSGDHGADFYGRMDIGFGFGKVKTILLGQAKCESQKKPTNGVHVARTVARLKRGWVGAYVTTSYFSESVQREIIEDSYPILLINGKKIAEIALKIVHDDGYPNLSSFLADIDTQYENKIKTRRPEELLLE